MTFWMFETKKEEVWREGTWKLVPFGLLECFFWTFGRSWGGMIANYTI